jgi:hypothetical protein
MENKVMRYVVALMIALLVPTAAMAKGECKEDKTKFCKDLEKTEVLTCLGQHETELSAACKSSLETRKQKKEAKAKEKEGGNAAKTPEQQGSPAEPGQGTSPQN